MVADNLRVMACAPAEGAPGDLARNTRAVLARVRQAQAAGAELLVLPELCLCGSGLGSLFAHETLLAACAQAAHTIAAACAEMTCVFGLPLGHQGRVYSALAIAREGAIASFVLKGCLTAQQKAVFDPGFAGMVSFLGQRLPCATEGSLELGGHGQRQARVLFYDDFIARDRARAGENNCALYILPALTPAVAGGLGGMPETLAALSQGGAALAYANAGANESTTDLVYAGEAALVQGGRVLAAAPPFAGEAAVAELALAGCQHDAPAATGEHSLNPRVPFAPPEGPKRAAWCREALEIAARGLATRMARIGATSATLGVSGGLDSAIALLITCQAFDILNLPRASIHGYSLPGLGSSPRTRGNALRLLGALGLEEREIDLTGSILRHFEDIGQDPATHDAAYENAQARERTQVLMDLANRLGGLMVGSGDLSELALGFTTYGGDHMSMYGVNAGLYKSAIRLIIHQHALDAGDGALRDTLLDILATPISPELLPGQDGQITQRTEDLLGPYELNDFMLHHFLKDKAAPRAILDRALAAFGGCYSREDILSRMRSLFTRFFRNQFKRNCLPDGPAVLGVSLSPRGGFSLASDVQAQAWLAEIDLQAKA